MKSLRQAVIEHNNDANLIAQSMGQQALAELQSLMSNDDPAIRERSIMAMTALPLETTYKLLFTAVEDDNEQVALAAMSEIEKHQAGLSADLLIGLLEKLQRDSLRNPIVLMLGNRLPIEQSEHLNKYCNTSNDPHFVLHCMAALAKMGVEQRRQQFSAYLNTLHDKPDTLLRVFELVEYIHQPWLAPSLRLLLSSTQPLQVLNSVLPGYPDSIRVCDKAAVLINQILALDLPFITIKHTQYSSDMLAQVNAAASQYTY